MELGENVVKNDMEKQQIELQQQQKVEYKKIGSFYPTKGLKLFGFNIETLILRSIDLSKDVADKTAVIGFDKGLKPNIKNDRLGVVNIDSRSEVFFEALNFNSAKKRCISAVQGKKYLCNLNFVK